MACTCCSRELRPILFRPTTPRATFEVAFGRSSTSIRLPTLRVLREGDRRFVNLAEVWARARFPADLADLQFDFVGDDGFETATRRGPRALGDMLHEGYVDLETRDLHWQVELPCFYRVKGVAKAVARVRSAAMDLSIDGGHALERW